jgi:adenylate cyclase
VLLCPAAVIPADVLALEASPQTGGREPPEAVDLADAERQRLSGVLAQTEWNISRTAAILGITRNTVRARIAKYGLRPAGSNERMAEGSAPESSGAAATEFDELPLDRPTGESETEPADREAEPESPEDRVEAVAAVELSSLPGARAASRSGMAFTVPGRIDLARGRPSIAVLPFHIHGETEAKSYFGDAVVEDIIGALASVRELLVISRSSTLRYRGTGVDIRVVGRDVGVTYALSGSVRLAGSRLRVSVELAETDRGTVVWGSHFDGISEDLFALQDQIAARVVSTIAPHIREAELRRALRKRPESMEAYDCVLRGLAQLYHLNQKDFADARTWLEKAITLDPGYAAPYAWLAIWHSIRFGQGWSPDPSTEHAEVLRLSSAALERDSFDAMALALCGHAKSILRYEFDEAIALFERAIAASPSSAIAWTRSSPTYSYIGDAREAVRRAEYGLRLSPLDPHVFYAHTILGLSFYVAGEYDEAARWGRMAREENGQFTANLRLLAASLGGAGHTDEAQEVGQALLAVEPSFLVDRFVERYAIRDPERRDRLAHHLRLAGLPG